MGVSGDRKKFFRNISASEEEKQIFRDLIDKGTSISVRIIAEDSPTDVAKLVKE
jgi:PTS system mannose-specific IIB component